MVRSLGPELDASAALERLAGLPGCLLLESAMKIETPASHQAPQPIQGPAGEEAPAGDSPLGRYSFLMADPFETVVFPEPNSKSSPACDPWAELDRLLLQYSTETVAGLPPLQGGVAGLFSYDLNRTLEKLPSARRDDFPIPQLAVGAYDIVVAWDHQTDQTWIISQGFPELDPARRLARAQLRADQFAMLLQTDSESLDARERLASTVAAPSPPLELPEQSLVPGPVGLQSNFSQPAYIAAVKQAIDYICAGDVFQINLAQRLTARATGSARELYQHLRACNAAPFASFFDLTGMADVPTQVISASPERFFSVRDRTVETRPIKGTRRRTGQPLVDIRAREELLSSEKDRAENTMIVDLMRNDLAYTCDADSIVVPQLCELENYQSVIHLVSAVRGKLKPEATLTDLLRTIFPGGSITGAPKIRAMEIIAELEPDARGAYCGSMGYLGFDGSADLSILIRTITAQAGWWQIPVGGGIVSQSNAAREYEETWTKAAGMLRAVELANQSLGGAANKATVDREQPQAATVDRS